MPGITNPAEEYFKDGSWAWDPAAKAWLKLIIDPLTNRLVIDHPGDLEVVQPVPNDLRVGNYGWDGDSWQKLPMVWGFSGQYAERKENLTPDAGTVYLDFSTVPAGEVWVVTSFAARNNISVCTSVDLLARQDIYWNYLATKLSPAISEVLSIQCNIILCKDDYLRAQFRGVTAGDDVYGYTSGYKMKIAE